MAHILFACALITWSTRLWIQWKSAALDILLLLIIAPWSFRSDARIWLRNIQLPWVWLMLLVGSTSLASIVVAWKNWQNATFMRREKSEIELDLLKPMFLPCRTSHTRMFPNKHSFSYSYLFVGIPVENEGFVCPLLSIDAHGTGQKSSWFSVAAEDHLHRGSPNTGLKGKLQLYLRSQGLDPGNYPYTYLVTAPRFLGYQFNPVSFWYLYSASKKLAAMILEVNNTFDERRMYLLVTEPIDSIRYSSRNGAPPSLSGTHSPAELPKPAEEKPIFYPPVKFTQSWAKDFHVSPFNSRKGSYSLIAYDPISLHANAKPPINNTIVLKSSKGHTKLAARVFSTGVPLDPMCFSFSKALRFLAGWWWVGLVTFPRIVGEAGLLFFRKRLHVWFRPEVLKESMGRRETANERVVERFFRSYIKDQVERASVPLAFKYIAAGSCCLREETFKSPLAEQGSGFTKHLTLEVLSPAFYARFIHYAEGSAAIASEMHRIENDRTVWVTSLEELTAVWMETHLPDTGGLSKYVVSNSMDYLDYLRWSVCCCLRDVSQRIFAVSATPSKTKRGPKYTRTLPLSSFDRHIMASHPPIEVRIYRRTVTKIFLTELIAFSSPTIVYIYDMMLRFVLMSLLWHMAEASFHSSECLKSGGLSAFFWVNTVNIWALLKDCV